MIFENQKDFPLDFQELMSFRIQFKTLIEILHLLLFLLFVSDIEALLIIFVIL
jgi:hypothetical protein